MNKSTIYAIILIGLVGSLAACGSLGAPTPTPGVADVELTLTTNPSEPSIGDVELVINVMNNQGQPFTGADVNVVADHIDMRGMLMHGRASEQGNGQYALMANFSMSGNWKLSVQVTKQPLDHQEDIIIQKEDIIIQIK
jgi:hypothetical protein